MKRLAAITLALIICLGATPVAGARFAQQDAVEQLTPEEEREARELGAAFVERFRKTNDIAPLIDEFFVEDFAERLLYDAEGEPMIFVAREVVAQASPAELSRFYTAQFNFFTLTLEYWMAHPHVLEAGDDGEVGEPTLEQMFPPEVAGVLRSDPHISAYITGEERRKKESNASEPSAPESGDCFVKSLAALREITVTTEKAVAALRRHVPPLSVLSEMQKEKVDDKNLAEVHSPTLEMRDEAFYGFPPSMRFICLYVEPLHDLQFHLYMVNLGGHLRIVAAFPAFGD